MNKSVGILGGMGTEATTYFYNKLMSYDMAESDQEHLRVILYNNSKIPDRTSYLLYGTNSPLSELQKSVAMLENCLVDFIVIPCNTSHYFYDELCRGTKVPIINIIDEVADEILSIQTNRRIGLLASTGTIRAKVYEHVFSNYRLELRTPAISEQEVINTTIYDIKSNKLSGTNFAEFCSVVSEYRARNRIDTLVLGCTELSIIKGKIPNLNIAVIDSNELLAYRTYLYAKGILRFSPYNR